MLVRLARLFGFLDYSSDWRGGGVFCWFRSFDWFGLTGSFDWLASFDEQLDWYDPSESPCALVGFIWLLVGLLWLVVGLAVDGFVCW